MQPVLTPEQMAEVDAASGPVEQLIERAGWEVALEVSRFLGGCYGRRIVVVAGKGNNGADGRVAARYLRRRGAKVEIVDPRVDALPAVDLVIDAAFGTGLRDGWEAPEASAPVLAVDIPSGLDPLTGKDRGGFTAELTVTFGAHKPGLLLGAGPSRSGKVIVAPIGLDLTAVDVETWLWTDSACAPHLPRRSRTDHKWTNAVRVLGGSEGMEGAPSLVASAAMRAGSGMVVVSRPDGGHVSNLERPVVQRRLGSDWVAESLADIERFSAVVIGPGLGTEEQVAAGVRDFIARCPVPVVIDADAIGAVAADLSCVTTRSAATVITPHDGEYKKLTGSPPGPDRIADVRALATAIGAVVLLKGPTTIIADKTGWTALVTSGDERLATAGTGDVLSGIIAAMNLTNDPWAKTATAAHWHGTAASTGDSSGVTADDVVAELAGSTSAWNRSSRRSSPPSRFPVRDARGSVAGRVVRRGEQVRVPSPAVALLGQIVRDAIATMGLGPRPGMGA